jgi:acrylyl-CoA reductase (NADPH)
VSLLGIESVTTPIARRREVWQRMAGDLAPRGLDAIRKIVALTDVEGALDEIARGGVTGRYVVDTTG